MQAKQSDSEANLKINGPTFGAKLKDRKGQGLVEYLVIVAIVAVGSIAVIKTVGGNINVQFAKVANALGAPEGSRKIEAYKVSESMYKKRDLNSFFEGSVNDAKKDSGSSEK